MGTQHTFHAPGKGADFLGWRISRAGTTEIVYENGLAQRMIFRICSGPCDETDMAEILQSAVRANRVVPALMGELKKRAIEVERLAY
ncbi:MAG: hypothetical protein H7317_00470 [Pseudorhodobacter sp.]|nr:hypothetical protein [Pseudorhodobacter sp.]